MKRDRERYGKRSRLESRKRLKGSRIGGNKNKEKGKSDDVGYFKGCTKGMEAMREQEEIEKEES